MNTGMKITAFAAALAATFGTAYGAGVGVGPLGVDPAPAAHADHGERSSKDAGGHGEHGGGEQQAASAVGGLQIAEGGYSLDLKTPRIDAKDKEELRFAVLDERGEPVTEYRREHDKELHLILASRDLATFRHVHPERAEDGTWSIEVELPRAGDYRLFADFTPEKPEKKGAEGLTLGADLAVDGDYRAQALPEPSRTAAVDGYTVTLEGEPTAGSPSELRLSVAKDGKPVTDLEPYLGAYGHLVALRAGDLAYLHVHPNGEPGDGRTKPGPEISFTATAPSASTYRLFLDFQHEGEVRTAAFTVRAGGAPADGGQDKGTPSEDHGEHSH